MSNDQDNQTASISDTAPSKKKRGAPKGVLRGPRPLYFVGAAIDNNNLILKSIQINDAEEIDLSEVSKAWSEIYGLEPLQILGPFYEKKGTTVQQNKSKTAQETDLNSITFSGEKKYGQYDGWDVIVQILKNPPNCGWLMFKNETGLEEDKKKQKPSSKTVKLDQVHNLRDNL